MLGERAQRSGFDTRRSTMSTIVEHTRDHRGMLTSLCPRCRTQFVYWDDDDLDDNGDLRCYCEEEDR